MHKHLPKHSVEKVLDRLFCCPEKISTDPPKILILYGSIRKGSFSQLLAEEVQTILKHFGANSRIFHPHNLPLADTGLTQNSDTSLLPKPVLELRKLVMWSEGMVWISPEVHGSMSAVFKNQIDWIPLIVGSVRPTQGKLLALMQVEGGSQSFNVVNQMRVLGRWMRMFTIPNQSSIPRVGEHFDKEGKMKHDRFRERVIDVLEELFKFTLLFRDNIDYLVDRYSEDLPSNKDLKNQSASVKSLTQSKE